MPGFDQTGPMGRGPMTGRMRGVCGAYRPRYDRGPMFRGGGYGPGFGRGFRQRVGRGFLGRFFDFQPPYSKPYPEDKTSEMDWLKTQADSLTNELKNINRRMTELKEKSS